MTRRNSLRSVDAAGDQTATNRDVWLSEDGGYSMDNFYTGSKDAQGHSTFVRIRVPDHIYGLLGRLIASGEVPELQTIPAAFRDAIHHRIRYLAATRQTRTLSRLAQAIELQDDIEQQSRVYEQMDELLETSANVIQRIARYEDREKIQQVIESLHSGLRKILDATEYERVKPKFDARIQRLLVNANTSDSMI